MKKSTLLFLSLFFVFGSVIAQNAEKKWAIGLGPGVYNNNQKAELGFAADAYLSRYLNPSFDLMINLEGGFQSYVDWVNPMLKLRYKLFNGYIFSETAAIQPYLYGAGGILWDNQTNGFSWDAGLGFKFPVSANTSLFIEGGFKSGVEGTRAGTCSSI